MTHEHFVSKENLQDVLDGIEQKISGLGSQLTGIYTWVSGGEYKIGDVVIASGSLFICLTTHTASSSFSADIANWQLIFADIDEWRPSTYYVQGSNVITNNALYKCNTTHTSALTFDSTEEANWDMVVGTSGAVKIKNWATTTEYKVNDVVLENNVLYRCITAHTATTFSSDIVNWELIYAGIIDWSANTYYPIGAFVINDKKLYKCKAQHTSGTTFVDTNWNIIGGGTSIANWTAGTSYSVGDIVIYSNKIYQCKIANSDSTFTPTNWQLLGGGGASINEWAVSTAYSVGDYVKHDNRLYCCNTAHTSDATDFNNDKANWDAIISEDFVGATNTVDGNAGGVPKPKKEDVDKYLSAKGTWENPPLKAHVKSVVLWEGQLYTQNDVVTLSDDYTNYDRIVVYLYWSTTSSTDNGVLQTVELVPERDYQCEFCYTDQDATSFQANTFYHASIVFDANTAKLIYSSRLTQNNYYVGRIEGLVYYVDGTNAPNFRGATPVADGKEGLVPKPLAGEQGKYLNAKGTWEYPSLIDLYVKSEILWSGTLNTLNQVETLTANYTDYDKIKVYLMYYDASVVKNDILSVSEFIPAIDDKVDIRFNEATDVTSFNRNKFYSSWMEFQNNTVTLKGLFNNLGSQYHIGRIEGLKYYVGGSDAPDFQGASGLADGKKGLVPEPKIGDQTRFLCGDGTWKALNSSGGSGLNVHRDLLWEGWLTSDVSEANRKTLNGNPQDYDYIEFVAGWDDSGSSGVSNGSTGLSHNFIEVLPTNFNPCPSFIYGSTNSNVDAQHLLCDFDFGTHVGQFFGAIKRFKGTNTTTGIHIGLWKIYGVKLFNPLEYSTTEKQVGVWVDGKAIYQTTFTGTFSTTATMIDVSSIGIDKIIDIDGTLIDSINVFYPINYYNAASNFSNALVDYDTTVSNKRLFINTGLTGTKEYYVTIRYTKT